MRMLKFRRNNEDGVSFHPVERTEIDTVGCEVYSGEYDGETYLVATCKSAQEAETLANDMALWICADTTEAIYDVNAALDRISPNRVVTQASGSVLTVQLCGGRYDAECGLGTLSFEPGSDGAALMVLRFGEEEVVRARVTQEDLHTHASWIIGHEDGELLPYLGASLGFSRDHGHLRVYIVAKADGVATRSWFDPEPDALRIVLDGAALECKRRHGRVGAT